MKFQSFKTFNPTTAEKRDLKLGRKEYKAGDYITLEELKKKLNLL